jgi:hypothetical protein
VWAIDLEWLESRAQELLGGRDQKKSNGCVLEAEYVNFLLRRSQEALIIRGLVTPQPTTQTEPADVRSNWNHFGPSSVQNRPL